VLEFLSEFRQLAAFSKFHENINISITTNKNTFEEPGDLTFCAQVREKQNVFLSVLF